MIQAKPEEDRSLAVGPWYFGISHLSTRLADLAVDVHECDVLMRMAIASLAQWSMVTRYDIAQTKIETYNATPTILVIRMHGEGQIRKYQNIMAATGEIGFAFLDHNPNAANVLRELCSWWLCKAEAEELDPSAPGRKVIWALDGFIIVKYISPFEDFTKAQVM